MEVQVRIDDGADGASRSLVRWLARDPDLNRHAHIYLDGGDPQPGDMGPALEIINLVV
ncbi:MAG: hypothetical protein LC799_22200, partial [Actinobacteria bacterium]|nr:hypothetical protein [Actinomycetota bacterium]